MLILSRVCADFHDRNGNMIHRVTPLNRLTFHEAPDAIRDDPLFRMLVSEGSLEAGVAPVRKKELENDPLEDEGAGGKAGEPAPSSRPARRPARAETPETAGRAASGATKELTNR